MKALLVIDVQKGLTAKKLFSKAEFLETLRSAIGIFRRQKLPIVFIQHNNGFLVEGESDWELDDRLEPAAKDTILQKRKGNSFKDTGLSAILRERGVDGIIACGLVSHGCVRATCIGAVDEGFQAFLLKGGHTNWAANAKSRIEAVEEELGKLGVGMASVDAL